VTFGEIHHVCEILDKKGVEPFLLGVILPQEEFNALVNDMNALRAFIKDPETGKFIPPPEPAPLVSIEMKCGRWSVMVTPKK
jgi:hypothetical protein